MTVSVDDDKAPKPVAAAQTPSTSPPERMKVSPEHAHEARMPKAGGTQDP